jgi:hypothetical protein
MVFAVLFLVRVDVGYARAYSPTPIELSLGFGAKRVALSGPQVAA